MCSVNQKDVSLAHLKALLAIDPIKEKRWADDSHSSVCHFCESDSANPGGQLHATNCVYVAAQDHVARITDENRSEAMQGRKTSPPRYSDRSVFD
jgi:hypothetical protein